MAQVSALTVVSPLADRLLESDLPDLPSEARQDVLRFVCHRVDTLPSFTRFGVLAIGTVFRVLLSLPGGWFICRALMAPGLWSQGITTIKPDDSMREVSIRSLELASARHSPAPAGA